jgi:hypothetical protein
MAGAADAILDTEQGQSLGVGHVGPGPAATGGATSQDAAFGRAVRVETYTV